MSLWISCCNSVIRCHVILIIALLFRWLWNSFLHRAYQTSHSAHLATLQTVQHEQELHSTSSRVWWKPTSFIISLSSSRIATTDSNVLKPLLEYLFLLLLCILDDKFWLKWEAQQLKPYWHTDKRTRTARNRHGNGLLTKVFNSIV